MRILSRYIILILCVLVPLETVAAKPFLLAPSVSGGAASSPSVNASSAKPRAVITGFGSTGCVSHGALLTVLGNNFGSLKGLSLVAGSSHIPLKITVWQNSKIIAYLPTSAIMKTGTGYPVGIRDIKTGAWLSNINRTIISCQPTPTGSGFTKPVAPITSGNKIASPPDPIASSHPGNNEEGTVPGIDEGTSEPGDFNGAGNVIEGGALTTPTVLPIRSGLLMNRQLPLKPPNISVDSAVDASGNAIAEPGELLVVSSNMDEARQLAQQLGGYGLSAKKRKVLKNLGLVITTYRVPADVDLQQTAANIRQAYPAMWADINHRYTLQGSSRTTQAAKNLINWKKGDAQCGKGLRIGLIDTAINTEHPVLKLQSITSHSVLTHGIAKANKLHGTAIATILIGRYSSETLSGMLPAAKLYSASVFRQRDKHNIDTTAEWIVSGIDWLLSQNVQVINMSVGGPRNLLVDIAIQRTIQSGVPVIAAAGNGGSTATAVYPAAQPGVIAVTAVDSDLELYSEANEGEYIDFAAPGVDIWAGNEKGTGKFVSGTSFSVPYITAVIANIVGSVGPKEAYIQLQNKAKDLGNKGKDKKFGWGLVQVKAACQ